MNRIRYVEIENFKIFSDKLRIDLDHPAVLIGPNNAGKTSVIQALSLWNRGIREWYDKKGGPGKKGGQERISSGINRLNILDVPVSETRFFWNGTRVKKGNTNIEMKINVGIEGDGMTRDCRMLFTYRDSEVIYCRPCPETMKDEVTLRAASKMQFHLLYPMSGIMSGISADTEETPLPDGRINVYLGQGQTAQVLRNICYKVIQQDDENGTHDWDEITRIIELIFLVELRQPLFNESRGNLILRYRQKGVDNDLDISLAGRGLQQILLILAYLFWHKNSLLMVDEPDAHLEILRQKQVYEILKEKALKNGCQVIIATHSEVILDDAVDTNLTLLLHGEAVNLATLSDMKNALRSFGIEHYYKAKVHPRILYIEGNTDIEMLKAFAEKLNHSEALNILSGHVNCYYTRNVESENSFENRMDRVSGAFGSFKSHFHSIRKYVPSFKGIAIFDSDGYDKKNEELEGLCVTYWKNYELENYFISPDVLVAYVSKKFESIQGELFAKPIVEKFISVIDFFLLRDVFNNDTKQLSEFHEASSGLKRTLLKTVKMSRFADDVFRRFADEMKQPVLLNKGSYSTLIDYIDPNDISDEMTEKLELIVKYLKI